MILLVGPGPSALLQKTRGFADFKWRRLRTYRISVLMDVVRILD